MTFTLKFYLSAMLSLVVRHCQQIVSRLVEGVSVANKMTLIISEQN